MIREVLKPNCHSKKGITMVELIVAMVLTSIFAVICVSLINPIGNIYQRVVKLSKAQLLADTIVDSIRNECGEVKYDEEGSVWIADLNGSDDSKLLSKGPSSEVKCNDDTEEHQLGNALVIRKNNNYTEAIFSCVGISDSNYTKVHNNPVKKDAEGNKIIDHSIDTLLADKDTIPDVISPKGIVHFGYYQSKEDDRGIYPFRAYDYTNPVLAETYGKFTVKLEFNNLVKKDGKYPAYVNCTVSVYEGDYNDASVLNQGPVYSRTTVLCFSANGSGNGTGGSNNNAQPNKSDIEVKIVWDDNGSVSKRPERVTVTLWNKDKTKPLGTHIVTGINAAGALNEQRFKFSDVDVSGGFTVTQDPSPAATGYQHASVKVYSNRAVITNKYSAVTLLSGSNLNAKLHKNDVLHVVFGQESDIRTKVALPSSYDKVAIAGGDVSDEYKLYYVSSSKTVYIVSNDGTFIANPDCSHMFDGCKNLLDITWNNTDGDFVIDTSNTTNMAAMFKGCAAMTQFNLKDLVKGSCTSTSSMFEGCIKAQQINFFSTWNTSSVSNMSRMFYNYARSHDNADGVSIDISSFDFSGCNLMSEMFAYEKSDGKKINEIKFPAGTSDNLTDMHLVTTMEKMFYNGSGIQSITNFNCLNCSELLNVNKMFDNCSSLTSLDLKNFKMPKCDIEDQYEGGKQYHAFWGCNNLTTINLDGWDISSETSIRDFFAYMPKLEIVSLKDCKTPNLQSVEGLFYHCYALKEVYMPGFVGEKCTTIRSIFNECKVLEKWDISNWNTSGVKYLRSAFYMVNLNSPTAIKLDISTWDFNSAIDITEFCYKSGLSEIKFKSHSASEPMDFNKATSIRLMFAESKRLTKVENFNHASFNSLQPYVEQKYDEHGPRSNALKYGTDSLFSNCSSLTSIDVSDLNMPTCESIRSMFNGCGALTHVVMNDVNLNTCTTFDSAFANCSKLNTIEMNRIVLGKATNLSFISVPANLKKLYMTNASLPQVTTLSNWFKEKGIEYIEFTDVDLDACTNTSYMFYKCYKLQTVKMNNFKTPGNTTCASMFENCYSIKVFEADNWNTGNVTSMNKMFYNACYYDGSNCTSYDKVMIDMSSFDFTNVMNCEYMFSCNNPGDYEEKDCLGTVKFPSSAKGGDPYAANCTTFYNMFKFRKGLSYIENLGEFRVNVEVLANISYIFSNTGVITLDVSGLNLIGSTASAKNMFESCGNLTTIYAATDTDWSSVAFSTYATMFNNSKKIVGGNNTAYNPNIVDKRYARIDKEGYPGYFTDINQKPTTTEANP